MDAPVNFNVCMCRMTTRAGNRRSTRRDNPPRTPAAPRTEADATGVPVDEVLGAIDPGRQEGESRGDVVKVRGAGWGEQGMW